MNNKNEEATETKPVGITPRRLYINQVDCYRCGCKAECEWDESTASFLWELKNRGWIVSLGDKAVYKKGSYREVHVLCAVCAEKLLKKDVRIVEEKGNQSD